MLAINESQKTTEQNFSKVFSKLPTQKRESTKFKAFYCETEDRTVWIERDKIVRHQTILCPYCGSNNITGAYDK